MSGEVFHDAAGGLVPVGPVAGAFFVVSLENIHHQIAMGFVQGGCVLRAGVWRGIIGELARIAPSV
jgi:hypothetical protein